MKGPCGAKFRVLNEYPQNDLIPDYPGLVIAHGKEGPSEGGFYSKHLNSSSTFITREGDLGKK